MGTRQVSGWGRAGCTGGSAMVERLCVLVEWEPHEAAPGRARGPTHARQRSSGGSVSRPVAAPAHSPGADAAG